MPYIRDSVIILKNEPFRECDSWISMYGRMHGKMTAVARGARKSNAKSLGHLEPLSEVDVMIAKGITFDKLAVARFFYPRPLLRERLGSLAVGGSFAHLTDTLTRPGLGDESIYRVFRELLDLLNNHCAAQTLARYQFIFAGASLKLLDLLGYGPALDLLSATDIAKRLLAFLRREPLSSSLSVTAPTTAFEEVSVLVQDELQKAALHQEPQGNKVLLDLMG